MKKLFVPYAIALALKEKGFDEPCLQSYVDDKYLNSEIFVPTHAVTVKNSYDNKLVAAPIHQQVVNWLKEKHDIDIEPTFIASEGGAVTGWSYNINFQHNGTSQWEGQTHDFKIGWGGSKVHYDYKNSQEAMEAAIEEALKLI